MPDDSDMLNSEAMYGASRSMQVLSSHVGIGSFIEYLSVASRTIVQTTSVVIGTKADSRSDVEMSLNTGGAPSVADLISAACVEIVGKGLSRKPRVSDRCTISTPAQSIVYGTPQRRLVTSSVHPRPPELLTGQGDALFSVISSNCHEQHQCAPS